MRLILIGPRPNRSDAIGGTKISFEELCDYVDRRADLESIVIDTSRPGANTIGPFYKRFLDAFTLLRVLAQLIRALPRSDATILNISASAAVLVLPSFTRIISFWFHKPLYVRIFGGDMHLAYSTLPLAKRRKLDETFNNIRRLFLQTRNLIEHFDQFANVSQWPTSRDMPSRPTPLPSKCTKVIFLSQVKISKGIPEILTAARAVGSRVQFSIFGPMFDCDELLSENTPDNVQYHGKISHAEVPKVLADHDLLILPSRRAAEGYPGIVIEAFQMGLPVITSDLPNIAELIVPDGNGLTIPVGRADALADAIRKIWSNPSYFRQLQKGAIYAGREFRRETILDTVLEEIKSDLKGVSL